MPYDDIVYVRCDTHEIVGWDVGMTADAVESLRNTCGTAITKWRYGQFCDYWKWMYETGQIAEKPLFAYER